MTANMGIAAPPVVKPWCPVSVLVRVLSIYSFFPLYRFTFLMSV